MGAKDSEFWQDRMAVKKPELWLAETLKVLPPALRRLTEALIAAQLFYPPRFRR